MNIPDMLPVPGDFSSLGLSPTKTPAYQITINGSDATDRFQGRLISLTLSDAAGFEADQLDITLDDHDDALELPPTGAVIGLHLGYKGEPLVDKGTYTVDEVEHSGPPDAITLRARSADISDTLKAQKKKAWHQKTLRDIVTTIAKAHNLVPAIAAELAAVTIPHLDQTDESDAHFLTRLAQDYNAIATVKGSTSEKEPRLLFIRRGAGKTASGTALPTITISREDGDTHRYSKAERTSKTTGVRARWLDRDTAKAFSVLVGAEGTVKSLRKTYTTEQEAWQAANAEFNKLARGGATMELTLAEANLELMPEVPVVLVGWKRQIVEQPWQIAGPVVHRLEGGLTTGVSLALGNSE